MKLIRVLIFAVFSAFLTLAASAQVTFTNNDGTFTYDENPSDPTYGELALGTISNGLGSPGLLTAITGLEAYGIPDNSVVFHSGTDTCTPACMGTITLITGQIHSGTILTTAHFDPNSGSFMVSYTYGVPEPVSFSGTFTSSKWESLGGGTWLFKGVIMNGVLTIGTGASAQVYDIPTASTVQLTTTNAGATFHTNKKTYTFQDNGGTTNFSVSPEPASLTLFGTGLIVLGMWTRRRLLARASGSQNSQ